MTNGFPIPQRSVRTYLEWLERMGQPVQLQTIDTAYGIDQVLTLRTDVEQSSEIEFIGGLERMDWYDEWQVIGCFVSYTMSRREFAQAIELLTVARWGLKYVLEARVVQIYAGGSRP